MNRFDKALKVLSILKNELNIDLPILNISITNTNNNYNKKKIKIDKINYDKNILNKFDKSLQYILDNNINITEFINTNFYGNIIKSKFISSRIIRDVINNMFLKSIYKSKNRNIIIYSEHNVDVNEYFNNIDSILNFFDNLTNKTNNYTIYFYLSKKKKKINYNLDILNPDNINSGAALYDNYIIIFRREEYKKVLFHELIHYLRLDIFDYQDKFRKIYNKINLQASFTNPNEAYTEVLALLLLSIWSYHNTDKYYSINDYINKRLSIELGWSYYQICKILKYFKCYKSYEDLFSNKCIFKQDTNVLSYFFLKTYFLQNINLILKHFDKSNIYVNYDISELILSNTNLLDTNFSNNINMILNNIKIDDNTLRMTIFN